MATKIYELATKAFLSVASWLPTKKVNFKPFKSKLSKVLVGISFLAASAFSRSHLGLYSTPSIIDRLYIIVLSDSPCYLTCKLCFSSGQKQQFLCNCCWIVFLLTFVGIKIGHKQRGSTMFVNSKQHLFDLLVFQ